MGTGVFGEFCFLEGRHVCVILIFFQVWPAKSKNARNNKESFHKKKKEKKKKENSTNRLVLIFCLN